MPLVTTAGTNAQGFTDEEQAELDAAEQEGAAIDPVESPEPEPEPAPAPQASKDEPPAAQPDPKGAKPPPGFVPQAALHETREELRAHKAESAATKARMEQMFQQLVQRVGQQQQAQPNGQAQPGQIPDINADPIGHMQAKAEQLERELN